MKNKRFLGQHFLTGQNSREKIFEAVKKSSPKCNSILEIGPGEGALTEILLKLDKPLFAVEKDERLCSLLKEKHNKVKLFAEDARSFDLEKIDKKFSPILIVGNLPYYAATEIILHLLSYPSKISSAHFLIQKEVAHKFSSSAGQRYYSKYSVWAYAFYNTKIEFDIAKGAFSPPPKVISSFISFIPKPKFEIDESSSLDFFKFVEKLFQHQRKTFLSNCQTLVQIQNQPIFNLIDKNLRPKEVEPKYYFLAYST